MTISWNTEHKSSDDTKVEEIHITLVNVSPVITETIDMALKYLRYLQHYSDENNPHLKNYIWHILRNRTTGEPHYLPKPPGGS